MPILSLIVSGVNHYLNNVSDFLQFLLDIGGYFAELRLEVVLLDFS